MSKALYIDNCTQCPFLALKPFADFVFQCRHKSFTTGNYKEVQAPHVTPDWCPLEDNNTAAKCCAISLAIDSGRGNEVQIAEFIASEFNIDLTKLRAGGYNV